jgi:glycine/D-amino acid oxidase-like deaminating enzyme
MRVVVLGGGILGVSTARHLAQRQAAVTLVSDKTLGSGASGRSLSWLNSSAARSDDYYRLRMLGIDRYRELADQPWLRFDGGVRWSATEEETRALFAHHKAIGYPAEWVTKVAGVDVPEFGAEFNAGEGWVELPSLMDLLVKQFTGSGGELVLNAGPATITTAGDRVTGVQTQSGARFDADAVVLATGAEVPAALHRLGVPISDQTTPALVVRTERVDMGLREVVNTPRVSIRPTPDGALVLGAAWAEKEVPPTFQVPNSTVDSLLGEASAVLTGNPRLSAASVGAGLKPIPADDEPVLGRVEAFEGLHVAFTHSGATLALIAGELLADHVLTGEPHPLLIPYSPSRFTLS